MSIYTRFSFNDATLLKKWFCLISLWRKSSLEIISANYICVRHKNRRKHNQHFKLLFFKINLHFGTSEYISTYGKLDLLPINSIFWFSLLEKGKEDWCRPKYTTSFPYSVLKEVSHKPLKVAAAKISFPGVFIIDTTCFNELFSFHMITANNIYKNLSYQEAWRNRHVAALFQTSVLKEVCILYPLSPQ